jgi:hypothetical protein
MQPTERGTMGDETARHATDREQGRADALQGFPRESTRAAYRAGYDAGLAETSAGDQPSTRGWEISASFVSIPSKTTKPKERTMPSPYREGWGVCIVPMWSGEDEPEHVSDIEVEVVRLGPTTEVIVAGALCVQVWPNAYVPMENFQPLDDLTVDDTHDLRLRWFARETDARAHAEYTLQRWKNPQPWESFVEVG